MMTASDPLLLDLYACPLEPARWAGFLDRVCEATGACSAVVQAFKADGPRLRVHWATHDSRTRASQALHRSLILDDDNARLDMRRALRGLNRIARDEDLFEASDAQKSQLQQKLAFLGLGRFVGSLQKLGTDTYLGIALHRPVADRQDFSTTQVARLSGLVSHLGQAVELTGRLHTASDASTRMGHHFDRLRCGMLVCEADAHVVWMNRSAEALFDAGETLGLCAGRLRTCAPASTQGLLRAIANVAAEGALGPGRYVLLGSGTQALQVAVQPMASTDSAPCSTGKESVLLLVTGPATGGIPLPALTSLFGLTPAEALLVEALISGTTLDQHAVQRGVALSTVRWQLKQVLGKTGASRQADLVRVVLSSAAAQIMAPGNMAPLKRQKPSPVL